MRCCCCWCCCWCCCCWCWCCRPRESACSRLLLRTHACSRLPSHSSLSFADIFYNNCFKNGMLPVVLPREEVIALLEDASAGREVEVDLPSQKVIRACGTSYSFEVDPFRKHCLIEVSTSPQLNTSPLVTTILTSPHYHPHLASLPSSLRLTTILTSPHYHPHLASLPSSLTFTFTHLS